MNANQILILASAMGEPLFDRIQRQSKEQKERYWHNIGSTCPNCKSLCDPQEVFCSPECKGKYLANESVDDLLRKR